MNPLNPLNPRVYFSPAVTFGKVTGFIIGKPSLSWNPPFTPFPQSCLDEGRSVILDCRLLSHPQGFAV